MSDDRQPTDDEAAGIAWWNRLAESERARWLATARSATPADAWAAFNAAKRGNAPPD